MASGLKTCCRRCCVGCGASISTTTRRLRTEKFRGSSGPKPMNQEISVRLTKEVKTRAPGLFDKLQPALDLANRQLEWLCKAVMGMSRKGFVADLVAHVNRGTWLIVLANERKLFTMHFIVPPDAPFTRRQVVDDCCAAATEILGHVPTAEEIIHVID